MQERLNPYKITAHLDIDTEDEETQSDRDYKRNMEAAQPYYKKINYHPPVEAPCNCNTDDDGIHDNDCVNEDYPIGHMVEPYDMAVDNELTD